MVVSASSLLTPASWGQEEEVEPPPTSDISNISTETYLVGQSPVGVAAAVAKLKAAAPARFAVPVGLGGFNFDLGLRAVYVSNVYLTYADPKEDFIIVPECNISAYFPVGQLNSLNLNVGLAYYQYLKNTSLNTGIPLVNPNTDFAFNLYSGDFGFRFSENFSYQESPFFETGSAYYEPGSAFYNLYNTALFQRFQNRVGCLVTWDQNDLVMTAGYYHENLWSENATYSYIDHASELFNADAMLATTPWLTVGLEAFGSINNFDNDPSYNTWRAGAGPACRIKASDFVYLRMGVGYERIQYDSPDASSLGLIPENTYYAYLAVEHQINKFFRHSLGVWHDNQLGFNAANLEGTHVAYSLTWNPRKPLTISPMFSVNFYDESFGSTVVNLYHEKFTYYLTGLAVHYQLGAHWRAGASWYYRLKDSDIQVYGYTQNQADLELVYQF